MSSKVSISSPFTAVCLFTIHPILVAYLHNVEQVEPTQTFLPILISLSISTFLYLMLKVLLKNNIRATLGSVLIVMILWYYELIFSGLSDVFDLRHRHLVLFIVISGSFLLYLISRIRTPETLRNIHIILLVPISLLIVLNLVLLGVAEFQQWRQLTIFRGEEIRTENLDSVERGQRPDIYLIVLDEFAALKTIQSEWGYRDNGFADFLLSKGFYLAQNSKTRYSQTDWNVPSLLNINYVSQPIDENIFLDYIYNRSDIDDSSTVTALDAINFTIRMSKWNNSFLLGFLKEQGYKITVLEGASRYYEQLLFNQADSHITYQSINQGNKIQSLGAFHLVLINQSILHPVHDLLFDQSNLAAFYGTTYIFDYLKTHVLASSQPNFVFAHIMSPHTPFVFDADGSMLIRPQKPQDYRQGKFVEPNSRLNDAYLGQYRYVQNELQKVISSRIHPGEAINPVMIIQSDHGPRPHTVYLKDHQQAFNVFNAVYFPDRDYEGLDQDTSPINALRLMLNKYFNQNFDRLADK